MGILKFLWILSAIYLIYYLAVYLLERSKTRRATDKNSGSNLEYVVNSEQHQPITVSGQADKIAKEKEIDQDTGTEKKN